MADRRRVRESGALQTLEQLQQRHERRLVDECTQSHDKMEISQLKKKVQQLRKRKNELTQQLKQEQHQVLHEVLDGIENRDFIDDLTEQKKQEILTAVNALQCKKLKYLCNAYRLTGVSIESDTSKTINFRLDTFFQGQYWEPYYIEIQSGHQLKILRHTIPLFIPISILSDNYLNCDIQCFFTELLNYLNAYISRKQQVSQLKTQYSHVLDGDVTSSPALDFIEFTLKVPNCDSVLAIKLDYTSLVDNLPKSVIYDIKGKNQETLVSSDLHGKTEEFKNFVIPTAVDLIMKCKELFE